MNPNQMPPDAGPDLAAPSGPPDMPEQETSSDSGCKCSSYTLPVSVLQMPDESEQMQSPEVGDKVSYTVEGTVSSIDGDNAVVTPETINGQPVDADGDTDNDQNPANPEGDTDGDMAALQEMAKNVTLK